MLSQLDFSSIIKKAWEQFNPEQSIKSIVDISAQVSTNHVFRVRFDNDEFVIAKCSYYGKFRHFKEDHTIINVLANNLPSPFENFLARSLTKDGEVYTFQYRDGIFDAWTVFYFPITINNRLPRQLNQEQIKKLGGELARFHLACQQVKDILPPSSKTLKTDIENLLQVLETKEGWLEHYNNRDDIKKQCELFLNNCELLGYDKLASMPVFIDWNIGNFSVNNDLTFYSRWDYDWFRTGSRVLDFYFFSRVSSTIGDRTIFSYLVDPLMEERFHWFLQEYHKVNPLTRDEIYFMKEAYRFFIINYVVKDGRYFFHPIYANRLQKEAYEIYFPHLDEKFNAETILRALKL